MKTETPFRADNTQGITTYQRALLNRLWRELDGASLDDQDDAEEFKALEERLLKRVEARCRGAVLLLGGELPCALTAGHDGDHGPAADESGPICGHELLTWSCSACVAWQKAHAFQRGAV